MSKRKRSTNLLPRQAVEELTDLSCSSIYRLMREGLFPEPIKIGPKAVRWHRSEIEDYIGTRDRAKGNG